jgi:hypothetical protein
MRIPPPPHANPPSTPGPALDYERGLLCRDDKAQAILEAYAAEAREEAKSHVRRIPAGHTWAAFHADELYALNLRPKVRLCARSRLTSWQCFYCYSTLPWPPCCFLQDEQKLANQVARLLCHTVGDRESGYRPPRIEIRIVKDKRNPVYNRYATASPLCSRLLSAAYPPKETFSEVNLTCTHSRPICLAHASLTS